MRITALTSNKYFVPVLLAVALILLAAAPLYTKSYTIILLNSFFMYIVLTVSWVIFSGSTGYISLATAAFFGVGIYVAVVLGKLLPVPFVVLCGGLTGFVLAFLVGLITLRLRGVYFTIFTFGLVELIKHLVLWWEINISGIRGRMVVRVDSTTVFYIMLVTLVALLLTAFLIRRSRLGLALSSIGSCEEAAAHTGVDVTRLKVFTFALSAFFMGVTGTIMATNWHYIDPYIAFDYNYSFLPVLMAIFGGMGNIFGPVVGATVFAYLKEWLVTKFPFHYMLIFGVIMVVFILYLPGGLSSVNWKRLLSLFMGLINKIKGKRAGGKDEHASS